MLKFAHVNVDAVSFHEFAALLWCEQTQRLGRFDSCIDSSSDCIGLSSVV